MGAAQSSLSAWGGEQRLKVALTRDTVGIARRAYVEGYPDREPNLATDLRVLACRPGWTMCEPLSSTLGATESIGGLGTRDDSRNDVHTVDVRPSGPPSIRSGVHSGGDVRSPPMSSPSTWSFVGGHRNVADRLCPFLWRRSQVSASQVRSPEAPSPRRRSTARAHRRRATSRRRGSCGGRHP